MYFNDNGRNYGQMFTKIGVNKIFWHFAIQLVKFKAKIIRDYFMKITFNRYEIMNYHIDQNIA